MEILLTENGNYNNNPLAKYEKMYYYIFMNKKYKGGIYKWN